MGKLLIRHLQKKDATKIAFEKEKALKSKEDARFIVDTGGYVVDTKMTPKGSYRQPDGSRTDILQSENHGAGLSHTHKAIYNTNPNTGVTYMRGKPAKEGTPVSFKDVQNISSGKTTKPKPKGR